jgi:chemotaxis protein methyltransferase CheR
MRAAAGDPAVHYRDIVNSLHLAVLVVDADLTVQYANLRFYQFFGAREEDTLGRSLFAIQEEIWNKPSVRPLLEAVLPHDVAINGLTLEQTFPVIGERILNLSARRIVRDGASTDQMLLVLEDVTTLERDSKAAEETLQKTNAMMTEVHHRVKNNLASILSMIRIESRAIGDSGGRDVLERIGLRVDSMASLYELLAINENTGAVPLLPYFESVCRAIEQIGGASQSGWTIDVRGDDAVVSVDAAISIGAIVNELVANAAKYAFSGAQDIGRITVDVRERGGELVIVVADNGVGFDKGNVDPKSTGLGMKLVDMYLGSLGGTIDRETGDTGTTCTLHIPYKDLSREIAGGGFRTRPERPSRMGGGTSEVLTLKTGRTVPAAEPNR